MLKQWKFKKKFCDWPEHPSCILNVTVNPPVVNGLKIHSHIDEARKLGRPDSVTVIGNGSSVRLDFFHQGITLEYEDNRLVYFGILVSLKDDVTSETGMAPARATLRHGVQMELSHEIKAEGIIEVFGPPIEDDQDDEERILSHQIDEYTVETEFTSQNGLKRFNVFPT